MVHPLVGNDKGTLRLCQMGDGVLSKYGETVGGNQFRDAVVDFRVNMVRAPRQHNAPFSFFFQVREGLLALLLHGQAGGG